MTTQTESLSATRFRPAATAWERVIGDTGEGSDIGGPALVVVAGLHGNEPAGVYAARRVLARIEAQRLELHGRFVALAGNLDALAAGRRYIDRDLNRAWHPDRVARLREGLPAAGEASPEEAEDAEQRALIRSLDTILDAARGEVVVLDLHTTSSRSAPFILFADTLPNRSFALHFPVPLVLGLEEQVEGAMLDEVENRGGVVTMGVEGGQHTDPAAIDNLESILWIALVTTGCLEAGQVPGGLELHSERLHAARAEAPRVLEVRYRHAIQPGDDFRMEPGFTNFQPVAEDQLLAHDRRGPVLAREAGRVLMPLYQGQGEDGFFLTRDVRPIWLRVSEFLRRRRVGRLLPYLPGVREHRQLPHTLEINTHVARLFPLQVFHLLGYRKQRWQGDRLVVSRRVHDRHRGPSSE